MSPVATEVPDVLGIAAALVLIPPPVRVVHVRKVRYLLLRLVAEPRPVQSGTETKRKITKHTVQL